MRILWSAVFFVPVVMAIPGQGRLRLHLTPLTPSVLERSDTAVDSDRTQLVALTQKLLDGVATGDTALWNSYLTEDCLMMDPDGMTRTKAQLLAIMRPLPAGYSGTLHVEHP
ncbi:MAG TPA: nuclear transport factor 2 family protein, partial [Gemmatimonadaceae bacterium]|nr:nuclear transport factor 2 family protein [Gemmatimonadaceae bacterium]